MGGQPIVSICTSNSGRLGLKKRPRCTHVCREARPRRGMRSHLTPRAVAGTDGGPCGMRRRPPIRLFPTTR